MKQGARRALHCASWDFGVAQKQRTGRRLWQKDGESTGASGRRLAFSPMLASTFSTTWQALALVYRSTDLTSRARSNRFVPVEAGHP
jgi:hypothetical protein